MKVVVTVLTTLLILLLAAVAWLWPHYPYLPAEESPWVAERALSRPIVSKVAKERGYVNVNGPTVIRVPNWVRRPLGRYYMYFAHHKGSYIRMAYADNPLGPWQLYHPGVMPLSASGFPETLQEGQGEAGLSALFKTFSPYVIRDYLLLAYRALVTDAAERKARGMGPLAPEATHIASPEIYIDEANWQLLMYYHGFDERGGQSSRMAISEDGLTFKVQPQRVFSTYLRGFQFRDQHYLLGMPGVLYRASGPEGPFEPRDRLLFEPDMRHAGLLLEGSALYVFWSSVGYAPERILISKVDLSPPDWNDWVATAPVDLLRPELHWEGSALPVIPSLRGELHNAAQELRDPYVFRDSDGQLYLYYVAGGEKAIGVARLIRR